MENQSLHTSTKNSGRSDNAHIVNFTDEDAHMIDNIFKNFASDFTEQSFDSPLAARFATETEIADWDGLIARNPDGGDYRISQVYAEAKRHFKQTPRYIVFTDAGDPENVVSVAVAYERDIPLLGKWWYLDRGPAARTQTEFSRYVQAIRDFGCAQRKLFSVTIEPTYITVNENLTGEGNKRPAPVADDAFSGAEILHNDDTVIVDLDKSPEEILMSYRSNCRSRIRKALREGHKTEIIEPSEDTYRRMYDLMCQAGHGQAAASLESYDFYRQIWDGWVSAGQGYFRGYAVDGRYVIMNFVLVIGKNSYYVHGGSENGMIPAGVGNLIHYDNCLDAREKGAVKYDLLGIAKLTPENADDYLERYPLARFKQTFGRRITYAATYHVPIRRLRGRLWRQGAERLYSKFYRMFSGHKYIH